MAPNITTLNIPHWTSLIKNNPLTPFFFSALNVTWKQLYSRFTFYAHLCQMFKSINKIGGYIKVSRYTKIHLALKKFQPPWTHKAIQAWMHPFWLKKISSVLCWGTGTGCAKPIFDTQIISNRKYSNPLFPLTMLWLWETETRWWKEQVCGRQYKSESLISGHSAACECG